MNNISTMPDRLKTAMIAVACAGAAIVATIAVALPIRADNPPTFGTIPESLLDPTRDLDRQPIREGELPDYVVVWARDGSLAGYVSAEDAFGDDGSGRDGDLTVVNLGLEPVGLLTPNGFVANGERPADLPEATVTTVLGDPAAVQP